MRFLVDENLGRPIADGMAGFGEPVLFVEKFAPLGSPDEVILPIAGAEDLILLTRDRRMHSKPAQAEMLKAHRVGVFFMTGKDLKRCQLIKQMVRNWPRIHDLASRTAKPFAFRVPPNGTSIERLKL